MVYVILLLTPFIIFAQDDLLEELENDIPQTDEAVSSVFKGVKIINFESTKLIGKEQVFICTYRVAQYRSITIWF